MAKPTGVTNNWRIPTKEEIAIILQNSKLAYLDSNGDTSALFCLDGDNLKWARAHYENETYTMNYGSGMNNSIYFWPVINISY